MNKLVIALFLIFSTNSYAQYGGVYSSLGLSNNGGYGNVGMLISYFDGGIEYKNNNLSATTAYLGGQTPMCRSASVTALCFANVGYGSKGSLIKVGARVFLDIGGFIELAYEKYPEESELSSFNIGYGFEF